MTISALLNSVTHTGDGIATEFPFTFPVREETTFFVSLFQISTATTTEISSGNYSVTGIGPDSVGGTVTYELAGEPITSDYELTLTRTVPLTQEFSVSRLSDFNPETLEQALDNTVMGLQQVSNQTSEIAALANDLNAAVGEAEAFAIQSETAKTAAQFAQTGAETAQSEAAASASAVAAALADGDRGDITISSSGTVWTIDDPVPETKRFTPSGTGATNRTIQAKLREVVSVKDFGATGDGSTDDTAAIQAATAAVQGSRVALFFPPGTYKVTSTISITGALSIFGLSRYGTSITWTSTTLNVFSIASDAQVTIVGITFNGPLNSSAGAIISLAGSSTQNLFSEIRHCQFVGGWNSIVTTAAADWSIEDCYFASFKRIGVYVSNSYNIDAGDSSIEGCTFTPASGATESIYQASSGGLRVINNKILGGQYGYRMIMTASSGATLVLLITGNSIENQTVAGVSLERPSGAAIFGSVVVDGNEIAGLGAGQTGNWCGVQTDSVSSWLSRLVISDNQIRMPDSSVALTHQAILIGAAARFIIDGNHLVACANPGGSNYGISIGSGAANGLIGVNKFDVESGSWAAKISNGGTNVDVVQTVKQSGTATVASTTATGSLYTGTVAITFPRAYDSAPIVKCTPGNYPSGVSAYPTSITATGFTLKLLTATSQASGTYNASWGAVGVL